jgi:hypothetical protein
MVNIKNFSDFFVGFPVSLISLLQSHESARRYGYIQKIERPMLDVLVEKICVTKNKCPMCRVTAQ